jgi:hypothetical protein
MGGLGEMARTMKLSSNATVHSRIEQPLPQGFLNRADTSSLDHLRT